jgi:hypothetical protein
MKMQLNEVKQLQKIAGILKEDYPGVGEIVYPKDIDYDMMSYFSRTNRELVVTLKNGDKIQSAAGPFYNDIIFHGKFPENIRYRHYSIQIRAFDNVEIVG